jgi:hypothetical protein
VRGQSAEADAQGVGNVVVALAAARSRSISISRSLKSPRQLSMACYCASEGAIWAVMCSSRARISRGTGSGQDLVEQYACLLAVAFLPSRQEHGGILVLGVGKPRSGTHASVQRHGNLEMLLRLHPTAHRRREQAQVAIGGSVVDHRPASNNSAPGIGQHESVKRGRSFGVAEERTHSGEIGNAGARERITRKVGEVLPSEMFKLGPRLRLAAKFAVDQCQSRAPGHGSRVLLNEPSDGWLRLADAPLLPAQRKHPQTQRSFRVLRPYPPPEGKGIQGLLLAVCEEPFQKRPHGPNPRADVEVEGLPLFLRELHIGRHLRINRRDIPQLKSAGDALKVGLMNQLAIAGLLGQP